MAQSASNSQMTAASHTEMSRLILPMRSRSLPQLRSRSRGRTPRVRSRRQRIPTPERRATKMRHGLCQRARMWRRNGWNIRFLLNVDDINQGQVGDCYFLSALAEEASKNPGWIKQLVRARGDGTFDVWLYHN